MLPDIRRHSEFLRQFDVKEPRQRIGAAARIDRRLDAAAANATEVKRHRRPRAERQIGAEVIKPAEVFPVVARAADVTEGTLLKRAAADITQVLPTAQAPMLDVAA